MALNSVSTIKVLDLLCEGPIGGIIGGAKGIYLNETPIQNADGTYNYQESDWAWSTKIGGSNQAKPTFFNDGVSQIVEVNQEIGENYSEVLDANNEVVSRDYGPGIVIRQITEPQISNVQLLFTVPRLFSVAQESLAKGQFFGGTIRIRIFVQAKGSGAPYVLAQDKTINGISTNNYQFLTGLINLPSFGRAPWNIKVEKLDLGEEHFEVKYTSFQDISQKTSLANGRGNQIIWSAITEIVQQSVNYNYSAYSELSLSTKSFANLPSRAYFIRGRLVKIPTGAAVQEDGRLTFNDGAFDGSLQTTEKWTTCPICCFYDLLTNTRYGAGQFVEGQNLSWIDLYPLAKYANQLVTNPDGTQEPRFACNVVIGDRADAYSVLQDMSSVFRGILFWSSNVIQMAADHGNLDGTNLAVAHIYSNSNVIGGAFEYSGSSLKSRSTSVRVRFNDPESLYKPNMVVVEDADLIAKYGYQVKEIIAFGCTSKWQAQRAGLWVLRTEALDEEVVTFKTGLQGAVVLPGQIFAVADELRQGTRISGRIASATTTSVVVDQAITLPSGANPKLTCLLPNGTVETIAISSVSGSTISLSNAFTAAPNAQSIWSITTDGVENQKFRCIGVADGGDGTFTITGVTHNDSIYASVDAGKELSFANLTTFDEPPPAVSNISFNAGQINDGTSLKVQVNVSWTKGTSGTTFGYEVKYKTSQNNKIETITTTNPNVAIDNLLPGQTIQVEVAALGLGFRKKSPTVSGQFTVPSFSSSTNFVAPTQKLPEDPADVTLEQVSGNQVILRWRKPAGVGSSLLIAIIRHSSKTDGTGEWQDSTLLSDSVSADTTYAVLPKIDGEYLLKFQGTDGQRSANARSVVLDQPDPIPLLSITTVREDQDTPPYQGQKENVFYSDEYDALVIDGDETLDGITDFDAIGSFDFTGNQLLSGEYIFNNIVDLGAKFTAKFNRILTTRGLYPADLIDSRTELLDRWTDFDGTIADDTSTELFFRTSNTATVDAFFLLETGDNLLLETGDKFELQSDIDFGEWVPMYNGQYAGRQFQFKARLTSASTDQTPLVDELGFEMVMEARTEQSATIPSGAAAKAVLYDKAFYQTPALGLTAFNLATGDYYEVTSASRTGFTVTFRNSAGTAVNRNFQYVASGYGTEQT
jgi:predicted phage tail protein